MNIPLDEVIYFDVVTTNPSTGAVSDADSTPTFEVFEESTDTDIGVGGNLTKRTSKTGNYRGTFTLSAANGFEVGKWYSILASATVNSIAGKVVAKNFRVVAAEAVAGIASSNVTYFNGSAAVSASGIPAVNVTHYGGSAGTFSGGRPEVNTSYWAGGAVNAGVSGVPIVDVRYYGGTAATTSSGRPEVNLNASHGAVTFASLTCTGAFTVSDGVIVTASTTNRPAIQATGNGTGEAIKATAGATGKAVSLISVANHSLFIKAVGSYKHGVHVESDVDGNAICFQATHTDVTSSTHFGHGMVGFSADTANGNAVMLRALYHGCGLALYGYDNEAGFHIQGGATGRGVYIGAGASSGIGVDIVSTSTAFRVTSSAGDAAQFTGGGTGGGVIITAGTDGHGLSITGGATSGNSAIYAESQSGDCFRLTVSTLGHAINATAAGSSRHGLRVAGGSGGTSDGATFVAGTGGVGVRASSATITGATTFTGAVSMGSTLTVTGTTTLAAVSTSTITMAGLVVTNAASIGSTFTVTGGIVSAITGDITGNLVGKVTGSIVTGTVTTGGSTTSIPTSSLSPSASVADQFKGRIVIFDKATSTAALRGQASDITASSSGGTLTVTALTTAPSAGDTFVIV